MLASDVKALYLNGQKYIKDPGDGAQVDIDGNNYIKTFYYPLAEGEIVYERASSSAVQYRAKAGQGVWIVGYMNGFYLVEGYVGSNSNHKDFDVNPGALPALRGGVASLLTHLIKLFQ